MKRQSVTADIAIKLNELGFDEKTFGSYILEENKIPLFIYGNTYGLPSIKAPLYQQAIMWLHEKLDFYYPYLRFELYSDESGSWYQSKDEGNERLEIEFKNIEDGVLKTIAILKTYNYVDK